MKVAEIDENSVIIDLSHEEINILFGGYEYINYNDKNCKTTINKLLKNALPKSMLPLDSKSVLIEVKPCDNGCSILFTKLYAKPIKRYKKALTQKQFMLTFDTSDDMLSFIERLDTASIKSSSVYKYKDRYMLIAETEAENAKLLSMMKEFCSEITSKSENIAVAREYGKEICLKDAVQQIKKAFKASNHLDVSDSF